MDYSQLTIKVKSRVYGDLVKEVNKQLNTNFKIEDIHDYVTVKQENDEWFLIFTAKLLPIHDLISLGQKAKNWDFVAQQALKNK